MKQAPARRSHASQDFTIHLVPLKALTVTLAVGAFTALAGGAGPSTVTSMPMQAVKPAPATTGIKVMSSLEGQTTLPLRTKWTVTTNIDPEQVASVTYAIDGVTRWSEKKSPYSYGFDAGYLITTFLSPGPHKFTATVTANDGRTASNTVTATVSKAPAPPPALAGRWRRTRENVNFEGEWDIIFDEVGAWIIDPMKGGVVEQINVQGDVIRVFAPIQMGLADLGVSAYGAKDIQGVICQEGGPEGAFKWARQGNQLKLTWLSGFCGGRVDIWQGTWTRVESSAPRGPLTPRK
ncbi:hypothetical protein [Deinococcus yavapaiensis]|uniref:Uncharacterized protein n=1 Tax=Deinococcus yavapaiensis KR-236 TaxID=694435 RepID=A0A318RZV8_9DEIO|nr:hypothetical protein [Deinococcus yavapaiensis]PYE49478.1 hypothetical protein DES52_12224 [Deinococcus yavapaiensis KR-236]